VTDTGSNGSSSKSEKREAASLLMIRRALISVSDKRSIVDLARSLHDMGVEIVSTGGTFKEISNAGVPVTNITQVTGFPEILDGRVKSLHPNIHAGILADMSKEQHKAQLAEHGIQPIDLVVVNLYPFEQTIAQENIRLDDAIEQIDIGGPAMVRAAAKNFRHTAVVVNPDIYGVLLEEMKENGGGVTAQTRYLLAVRAFQHMAHYDTTIAGYLGEQTSQSAMPDVVSLSARKAQALRYGENPHQAAALYGKFPERFVKLHGKELSYNS